MKRLLPIVLCGLLGGCTFLSESFNGPRYKPRYSPREEAPAKPVVQLRVFPPTMVAPSKAIFQLLVKGDVEGCVWQTWRIAGGDGSAGSDCLTYARREYYVKCVGTCRSTVTMYRADGSILAWGYVDVEVGGGGE